MSDNQPLMSGDAMPQDRSSPPPFGSPQPSSSVHIAEDSVSPPTSISPSQKLSSMKFGPAQSALGKRSNSDSRTVYGPSLFKPDPFSFSSKTEQLSKRHNSTNMLNSPMSAPLSGNTLGPFSPSYQQQTRALMVKQRENFERERDLHNDERCLWDAERQELLARIRQLESVIENRSSHTSVMVPARVDSSPARSGLPRGPISQFIVSTSRGRQFSSGSGDRCWERTDSSATRSFDQPNPEQLHRIVENARRESEDKPSGTLSPKNPVREDSVYGSTSPESRSDAEQADKARNIDVSTVQKGLDGIVLKSRSIVPKATVTIPQTSAPPPELTKSQAEPLHMVQVKSPSPIGSPDTDSNSLSPHAPYLTQNAGHTPLAPPQRPLDLILEESGPSTPRSVAPAPASAPQLQLPRRAISEIIVPRSHTHVARTHAHVHAHPPTKHDSGVADLEHDPALSEPLALHDKALPEDEAFLKLVDMKLLRDAKKACSTTSPEWESESDAADADAGGDEDDYFTRGSKGERRGGPKKRDEPEVRLRFKRSMNFGSAFGERDYGLTGKGVEGLEDAG